MKEISRKGDAILMAAETAEEKEFFGEKIFSININQRRTPWFMQNFHRWRVAEAAKRAEEEAQQQRQIAEQKAIKNAIESCDLPEEIKELFCWCKFHQNSNKIRLTRATCPIKLEDNILPEWNSGQIIRPGKLMNMILKSYS